MRPPLRDDHTSSFVVVDTLHENVNVTHRKLVAYFGGLDLVSDEVEGAVKGEAVVMGM